MKIKYKGFTLIELVIVILILGILGAYTAPKFLGMDREARKAVMQSLKASVVSADRMIHAMAITQGENGKPDGEVVDGPRRIKIKYGYADASKEGIGVAVEIDKNQVDEADCSGDICVWKAKVNNPDECKVSYTRKNGDESEIVAVLKNCGN